MQRENRQACNTSHSHPPDTPPSKRAKAKKQPQRANPAASGPAGISQDQVDQRVKRFVENMQAKLGALQQRSSSEARLRVATAIRTAASKLVADLKRWNGSA